MTFSPLALEALAVDFPVLPQQHPNRTSFQGILTRVDEPSDNAPSGAQGHRVMLPGMVAEMALPTLLGMGVNVAADTLEDHAIRNKIGVITEAWVDGSALNVAGYLFAKDFPREVARLRAASQAGTLGMSFEIVDVAVADVDAEIWVITQLTFTGAAILKRASAAYQSTDLIAARRATEEDTPMPKAKAPVIEAEVSAVELAAAIPAEPEATDIPEIVEDTSTITVDTTVLAAAFSGLETVLQQGFTQLGELITAQGAANVPEPEPEVETPAVEATTDPEPESTPEPEPEVETMAVEAGVEERLTRIEAGMQLLTDEQAQLRGLLTDTAARPAGLLTGNADDDTAEGEPTPAPQRTTMTAAGEYEKMVSKHFEENQNYSVDQIDVRLREVGVTDVTQRLAIKNLLIEQGRLQ